MKLMPPLKNARIVFISSSAGSMGKFLGIRSTKNVAYGMSKVRKNLFKFLFKIKIQAAMNYYMKAVSADTEIDPKTKEPVPKWLTMSICPGKIPIYFLIFRHRICRY